LWRFIVWSLRLRRIEFRIAELPIFLIPILLCRPEASVYLSVPFWEGLVIFLLLFSVGDLVNCLTDRDLDATCKPHLSEAVYGLGVRNVVLQAVGSAVAALALTLHLAWLLDRWVLVPMVVVGLLLGVAYSVEPVRLKGRGVWQPAFFWLGLFAGPMLFAALLVSPAPPWSVWAVASFYGLLQTAVVLVNTAEDYPEDRAMGVRTVIVTLGLVPGIRLAGLLAVVGGVGLATSLLLQVEQSGGLVLLAWVLLLAVCAGAIGWIGELAWRIGRLTEEAAIQAVKRRARWVPAWITAVAWATLLVAAV
jgi:1,4-dihydroxy-2-naphthoate octaprenyltransferase